MIENLYQKNSVNANRCLFVKTSGKKCLDF